MRQYDNYQLLHEALLMNEIAVKLDPEKAKKFIKKGWNSAWATMKKHDEKVLKQGVINPIGSKLQNMKNKYLTPKNISRLKKVGVEIS